MPEAYQVPTLTTERQIKGYGPSSEDSKKVLPGFTSGSSQPRIDHAKRVS